MKFIDARMCHLVGLVALYGGRIDADHPALSDFSEDRPNGRGGHDTDTFNLCFDGGLLSQVQVDDDSFVIQLGA
ncbi:MAG: hypothetical protein AAGF48_16445 [Pseudomonadota bacterium]